MREQPTVADYIVRRLAREGITDCFGVAGDFAFKLCDAVARSEAVRWIGCSNELDAAYAADGYARVRGCSMLMTTYAVGELSALNGVMGARAERSCVFHLVGMPTMRKQRARQIVHHTLGDGEFQNFANISAQAACVSAVITPDNCAHEMERLIATARAESRPAYILVAADYAVTPVTGPAPAPYPRPASGPDLARAVAAIAERVEAARSLAVLPAYTVSRFKLQDKLQALIEALGCPFAAMAMDKGVLSEAHPQFVGIYSGAASSPAVLEAVERADVVIDAGGVSFNEINTAAYTSRIDPGKLVTIGVDHVRIADRIYNPVRMGDVFDGLARRSRRTSATRRRRGGAGQARREAGRPDHGGEHVSPVSGLPEAARPDRPRERQHGFRDGPAPAPRGRGGPASASLGLDRLGHRGHAGDRACRPVAADRALHRGGRAPDVRRRRRDHGAERAEARHLRPQQRGLHGRAGIEADPDWVYNDLAPWNYHALPAALGCQGWFTAKVTTLGELDAALARASTAESASYIEVVGGRTDFPRASPPPINASTHCTGMVSAPNACGRSELRRRKVNMCPDFIEDRGHTYGREFGDEDKHTLIEFVKHF